jgi:hypothetical protein
MRDSIRLIDEDPQHARFASAAQLNLHHLEPGGRCHPSHDRVYLIQINCHKNSDLDAISRRENPVQVKSGLAPTGVFRQILVLHNSSST